MEIIAEIGQNHNGDISLAKELIHAASENGADVAKFQVFDAKETFGIEGNDWFEYNQKTQLKRDDVNILSEECCKLNIEFMASVFHKRYIDWLEGVNVKRYKIASREIKNKALIEAHIKTSKPLIISLGFWDDDQFPNINHSAEVDFLYCISKYPTNIEDLNFSRVDFNKYSGFSDHTIGNNASKIAISRGARIIEKHFTLDKGMHGPDHQGSMTPDELHDLNKFRNDFLASL